MMRPSSFPWSDDTLASDGRPVHENFADFFKHSHVRDEAGLPRVVYHGTTGDIDSFTESPYGIFFAEQPGAASAYALGDSDDGENFDEGANVVAVYLSMQKPLYVTREVLEAFQAKSGLNRFADDFEDSETYARDLFMQYVREQDFDGLILEADLLPLESKNGDWGLQRSYVVFSASQIKSATGNSGLFLQDSRSLTDVEADLELRAAQRARQMLHRTCAVGLGGPAP